MDEGNQTNGGSTLIMTNASVHAMNCIPNEKGKIKVTNYTKMEKQFIIPFKILSEKGIEDKVDEVVFNAGYNQIREENGKIVRVTKNGTVLEEIKEEKYNEIYNKYKESKNNNQSR